MAERNQASYEPLKPGWIGVVVFYLAFAAVLVRTLGLEEIRPMIGWYLALEAIYLVLFTLALWKYNLPGRMVYLYLLVQSALVIGLLSLRPEFDFLVLLFMMLTYQASLAFSGRTRWSWTVFLVCLTGGSLIFYLGLLRGLALSLTTIAAEIILTMYIQVNHEIDLARGKSQRLVGELQAKHQQLSSYSDQVEELAALQERNRLARELHDTVSQLIFSISLTTRSAQLLLEKDPGKASEQLLLLQGMTGDALRDLRALITQLRSSPSS
jgi:signal transduction histidine kinase